jgi:hypothetical protein
MPKEGNPILASGCDNGFIMNDRFENNRVHLMDLAAAPVNLSRGGIFARTRALRN